MTFFVFSHSERASENTGAEPYNHNPEETSGSPDFNRSLRRPSSASLEKCLCGVCDKNMLEDICAPFFQKLFVVEGASMIFSPWWSLCVRFCINLELGIWFQLQTLTHHCRKASYCSMRQWTVNKLTVINQNYFTNLFLAFVDPVLSELRMQNANSVAQEWKFGLDKRHCSFALKYESIIATRSLMWVLCEVKM